MSVLMMRIARGPSGLVAHEGPVALDEARAPAEIVDLQIAGPAPVLHRRSARPFDLGRVDIDMLDRGLVRGDARVETVEPRRGLVVVGEPQVEVAHRDRVVRLVEQGRLLRDALLVSLARGEVLHPADHANGRAARVAQDVSPVEHPDVVAAPMTEAVLRRPALGAALDRARDHRAPRVDVVGVNAVETELNARLDLGPRVPEEGLHALVPPERVRDHVPVPDGVVRGPREHAKALFAEPHGVHALPDTAEMS
jgi:hypothetical protein